MAQKRVPPKRRSQKKVVKKQREPQRKAKSNNLAKVTLYIRPDQEVSILRIQLEQLTLTNRKPDKSELVQEAIDLLIDKYKQREENTKD